MVSNRTEGYSVRIINKLTLMVAISCLIVVAQSSIPAATTPAGAVIRNYATATYRDAGNNTYNTSSNEVTTTVIQVFGVDILPETLSKKGEKGQFVYFPFKVTNTGNGQDTFGLALSHNFSYPHVTNSNWSFSMYVEKAAGPITFTTLMNADDVYDAILEVSVPAIAPDDMTCISTITATSQGDPSKSDFATYETKLVPPPIKPDKKVDGLTHSNAFPGDTLNYTIDVTNTGNENLYNVILRDAVPDHTTYVSSSPVGNHSGGVVEWNISILFAGDTKTYVLNVKVNDYFKGIIQNQAVVFHNNVEIPSSPVTTDVDPYYDIYVTPDDIKDAIPGETVMFSFRVQNKGNMSDQPDLIRAPAAANPIKYTWDYFHDQNGTGNIDPDDTKLYDSDGDSYPNTPQINPGETVNLIARSIVSTTANDGDKEEVIVTGRSNGDINQKDEITLIINVRAPKVVLVKYVDPPSGQQPPGTTLTYTLKYENIGHETAYSVTIRDPVPGNTSYVENSVKMGGSLANLIPKTDQADYDEVAVEVNPRVVVIDVTRGNQNPLGPGEVGYIQFKVTIN